MFGFPNAKTKANAERKKNFEARSAELKAVIFGVHERRFNLCIKTGVWQGLERDIGLEINELFALTERYYWGHTAEEGLAYVRAVRGKS